MFDLQGFLSAAEAARKVVEFRRKERIFTQGIPRLPSSKFRRER
jgi:hypothetical protein